MVRYDIDTDTWTTIPDVSYAALVGSANAEEGAAARDRLHGGDGSGGHGGVAGEGIGDARANLDALGLVGVDQEGVTHGRAACGTAARMRATPE